MTERQQDEMSGFLERTARRPIRTVYRDDPSVLGGVRVLTGDTLMDGTLKDPWSGCDTISFPKNTLANPEIQGKRPPSLRRQPEPENSPG
jgi:hypothetical protein